MENALTIHSDGGARGNPGPGACAFIVEQNGRVVTKGSKYLGKVTNNFAEYSGVLLALDWLLNKSPFTNHHSPFTSCDSSIFACNLSLAHHDE